MVRQLINFIFVSTLLAGTALAEDVAFERTTLWVESGNDRHRFEVEVAETEQQWRRGLMFRADMAPDAGMLFDYVESRLVTMWMKNTLIELDMLFVDGDGVIRNIARRAQPLTEDHISSGVPVRAVVELNGGTADRLGIDIGDQVRHDIFEAN